MKKGLFIVGKDVDAHLASHINQNPSYGMSIDLMVLKHRDLLEFRTEFPSIQTIHSLPEFIHKRLPEYNAIPNEEIYTELRTLEEKYDLRVANRYIHYDFFRSRASSWDIRKNCLDILLYIKFFEEIGFGNYEFSYGELSRSYYLIAHDLANHYKTAYLSPASLGLVKGIAFVDDKFQIRQFDKKRAELQSNVSLHKEFREKATEFVRQFRARPHYKHSFLSNDKLHLKKVFTNSLRKAKNLRLEAKASTIDKLHRVDYLHSSPVKRIWSRSISSKLKGIAVKNFRFSNRYTFNPKSIYFPLHVHPETTTSLWSEFLVDHTSQQSSSVEYISKVIPTGYKLIVKEHPAMVGNRDPKIYSNFETWYNVDLVGPGISQFEIIKNSDLVLTLCGTVGLEALIMGKPVITLTDTYYSYFKQVGRAKTISQLEHEIPKLIKDFRLDDNALIEDLANLLYCVHHDVINFTIDDNPEVIGPENLTRFANGIKNELQV